ASQAGILPLWWTDALACPRAPPASAPAVPACPRPRRRDLHRAHRRRTDHGTSAGGPDRRDGRGARVSETPSFYSLTPDRVLDAVEIGGLRCTGRCIPLRAFENRVYEIELE